MRSRSAVARSLSFDVTPAPKTHEEHLGHLVEAILPCKHQVTLGAAGSRPLNGDQELEPCLEVVVGENLLRRGDRDLGRLGRRVHDPLVQRGRRLDAWQVIDGKEQCVARSWKRGARIVRQIRAKARCKLEQWIVTDDRRECIGRSDRPFSIVAVVRHGRVAGMPVRIGDFGDPVLFELRRPRGIIIASDHAGGLRHVFCRELEGTRAGVAATERARIRIGHREAGQIAWRDRLAQVGQRAARLHHGLLAIREKCGDSRERCVDGDHAEDHHVTILATRQHARERIAFLDRVQLRGGEADGGREERVQIGREVLRPCN